ncbi:MAG: hypothetical protein QNJ60_00365 [Xenococcaceae cyanobacterium MO_188.B19]|nr:hypothetical protein [Xenococcaceae cyanobacterium MO_188.B19]
MQIIKTILLAGSILLAQGNSDQKIPGLEACYPNWGNYEISKFISQTENEQKEYFLIYMYQPNFPYPAPLIISRPLNGGACKEEWFNHMGSDISFYRALGDRQIARQLNLGMYQKELKNTTKEAYQNFINEVAQVNSQWREERIWALKQLGFSIPENVRSID